MPYSLRAFIGVWLLYFFLVLLAPAYSLTSEMPQVVALDFLFVFVTCFAAVVTTHLLSQRVQGAPARDAYLPAATARRIVNLALVFSLIGLLALMFDKIQIQNIDYGGELARAREEWRELGEGREGVSSPYSVAGYALSTSFIVALIPVMLIPGQMGARRIGAALLGLFFFLMMNSVLIGGRSIILVVLAFAFSFYSIRLERGGQAYVLSKKTKIGLLLFAAITTAYIFFVFMSRASATHDGVSASDYLESMQSYMELETAAWPRELEEAFPALGSIVAFGMLIITYLSHSAFIFAEYLEHQFDYGNDPLIVFNHLRGILSKVGLMQAQSTDWFLAGRFPSLPGALFHDGGHALLFGGALMLGVCAGGANYVARGRAISIVQVGFIASVYTTLFLSPLLFAGDIMSFPFIVFEFIVFWMFFLKFKIRR